MPQIVSVFIKVIFALVGLICIIFSYLIGIKGKTTLISGYDPAKVKDERGLSRFIGIFIFILGLFTILYPLAYAPNNAHPIIWILFYCVPIIIIAIIMVIGSSRYEYRSDKGEKVN
jgi:hypothetical protein